MTILAEIKLLIGQCAEITKDGSLPIISRYDRDRYIEYLNELVTRLAIEPHITTKSWNKVYYAGHCPVCGFDQTEGKSVDIDGGTATQDCYCLKCDGKWTNTYTLRETTITWTTSPEQST